MAHPLPWILQKCHLGPCNGPLCLVDTKKPTIPVCFLLSMQATLTPRLPWREWLTGHLCHSTNRALITLICLWMQIGAVFLHVYKLLNILCGFFWSMAAIQTKETVSVWTPLKQLDRSAARRSHREPQEPTTVSWPWVREPIRYEQNRNERDVGSKKADKLLSNWHQANKIYTMTTTFLRIACSQYKIKWTLFLTASILLI